MNWLRENWFWVVVFVGWFWMHSKMHAGHGHHGGHGGRKGASPPDQNSAKEGGDHNAQH